MAPLPPPVAAPPVAIQPISIPPSVTPPSVTPSALHAARGNSAALDYDAPRKNQTDACMERLHELNVDDAPKIYVAPSSPGTTGRGVEVQSNVFGIEIEKEFTVYHYTVHAIASISPTRDVVFTKKAKEDFVVLDRHEKCCDIFFHAVEANKEFFKINENNKMIYDGQNMLFTTVDLGLTKSKIFEIDGAKLKSTELHVLPNIQLEIVPTSTESIQFSSEILGARTADANIEVNNRAYTQVLELALNQKCVRDSSRFGCFEHGKVYFLNPADSGFHQQDCVDVGDGKSLLPGLKKTVQFIEGPYGRGQNNPSIVIDAMKAAFHKEQCVLEKIGEVLQKDPSNGLSDFEREKAFQVMRGLDVHSTYTGRTRHMKLEGIYKESAAVAKFEIKDGSAQTVQKYFEDTYKITLKHPHANLLVCKERGNKNFFPAELLTITKNQRVTIPQQTGAQSQRTTKECAVLPDVRQRLIMTGKDAVQIDEKNELLNDLGIKVYPAPLMVKGRELEARDIQYAANRSAKAEAGKWRAPFSNYANPSAIPQVWAAYAVGTQASRFSNNDMQAFIQQFMEMCSKKGMQVPSPAEFALVGVDAIEDKLQFAIKSKCKFIFLITEDTITHLHPKIKMLERDHSVIIQDMKMSRASTVVRQGKKLTLENVVNKTNVKLGGLNYFVADSKKSLSDDQLVIGVGISAPPPGTKFMMEGKLNPQIVGFASNAKSTHEFTGDFVLAQVVPDTLPSIEDALRASLEMYKEKRASTPKRVIVYRSGASEGSHGAIIAYEVPLARAILREYAPDAKMVYMVVTKDHTHRFFKDNIVPGERATDMNIPAGIVIDTGVTHPACKQFFMNSHTTLQGSAKSPLYTVLADDCNAGMDRLEELTYTLCHHHQIVALSTSLPTPLYVANEYAKRGRDLWSQKMGEASEYFEGTGKAERARLNDITREISYKYTDALGDMRINA